MKKNKSSNEQNCVTCAVLQREIGDLKREIAEMDQHVYLDTLTGLPNRRYFVQSLQSRVERCRRYGDNCAVLFLDVDDLKKINDNHGHAAGDIVLARLAQILRLHIRTSDIAARIGGDEFGLLFDNMDADEVEKKIAYLVDQFGKANCTYADQSLPVDANVRYCFVGPKDTVEGLMSRADAAMYRAKEKVG